MVGHLTKRNEERIARNLLQFYLNVMLFYDKENRKLSEIKENSAFIIESN